MIYVVHHAVALALAVLLACYLPGAGWTRAHPRLAIVLWQTTGLTVVLALVGGLLAAGLAPYRQGIVPGLRSFLADPPEPGHALAVAAGLSIAAWLLGAQLRFAFRIARHRARHRDLLTLVAGRGDGSLVLDHPLAVAYCLPGRTPRIVVSTGTRRLLSEAELRAVLAHERAHLRGRHHLVLWPFAALAQLLPRWSAPSRVAEDIALLVEMCADDYAVRRHGRLALTGALEKFRALGGTAAPAGALAAAAAALPARINRLRAPGAQVRRLPALLGLATALTVLATSVSLYITPL